MKRRVASNAVSILRSPRRRSTRRGSPGRVRRRHCRNHVDRRRRAAIAHGHPIAATLPAEVVGVDYDLDEVIGSCWRWAARSSKPASSCSVTVPSWRPDLRDPFDLVEEVARLVGYDRIPSIVPDSAAQWRTDRSPTRAPPHRHGARGRGLRRSAELSVHRAQLTLTLLDLTTTIRDGARFDWRTRSRMNNPTCARPCLPGLLSDVASQYRTWQHRRGALRDWAGLSHRRSRERAGSPASVAGRSPSDRRRAGRA